MTNLESQVRYIAYLFNKQKLKYMYKQPTYTKSNITGLGNQATEGEPIEKKVQRIKITNEPIKDSAPQIYTTQSEGVLPEYDIRTDKMETAIELKSIQAKNHTATRSVNNRPDKDKIIGKAEPTPTTSTDNTASKNI